MNQYTPSVEHSTTAFFSAIPRHVFTLRQSGALKARDVEVLGLLLDYKEYEGTTVEPSQDEMTRRLNCSLDTIQRSLNRLKLAGLIIVNRLRDLRGKLGKCVYDLAAVFALMPEKAAGMRYGKFGKTKAAPSKAIPHERGTSDRDSSLCSIKADNSAAADAELPKKAAAVVSQLLTLKTERKTAVNIVSRHGEEICKAALVMLSRQKAVSNPLGWLRTCLGNGWVEKEQGAKRQENKADEWKLGTKPLIEEACLTYGRKYVHTELCRRYDRSKERGEDMTIKDAVMAWFRGEVLS